MAERVAQPVRRDVEAVRDGEVAEGAALGEENEVVVAELEVLCVHTAYELYVRCQVSIGKLSSKYARRRTEKGRSSRRANLRSLRDAQRHETLAEGEARVVEDAKAATDGEGREEGSLGEDGAEGGFSEAGDVLEEK